VGARIDDVLLLWETLAILDGLRRQFYGIFTLSFSLVFIILFFINLNMAAIIIYRIVFLTFLILLRLILTYRLFIGQTRREHGIERSQTHVIKLIFVSALFIFLNFGHLLILFLFDLRNN